MGFLSSLFESRESRKEREQAERITSENEAKRRAAKEARMPKCERCGRPAERLIPMQLRAAGRDSVLDLDVCSDCFAEAAKMAQDAAFKFK